MALTVLSKINDSKFCTKEELLYDTFSLQNDDGLSNKVSHLISLISSLQLGTTRLPSVFAAVKLVQWMLYLFRYTAEVKMAEESAQQGDIQPGWQL